MSVEIFLSGCSSCGGRPIYISKVAKEHTDLKVINTRIHKDRLQEHLMYQKSAGMQVSPLDIVVEDGGKRVVLLREWK